MNMVSRNYLWYEMVNHGVRVETLFEVLEDFDPKLKALGVIELNGNVCC